MIIKKQCHCDEGEARGTNPAWVQYASLFLAMTLLTSCSSVAMNSSFACGVGDGLGCKSVSEVNDIVENGPVNEEHEKPVYSLLNYYEGVADDALPERVPEKRLKIWFAPHIDAYDNYVEETVVYSVIKESHWVY